MGGIREQVIGKARDTALTYLARRGRSVHEMRQHLLRRGFDPGVVEQVLEGLARARLLDDEAFAREWVEWRLRSQPAGALRLTRDLRARGVPGEIVEETLAAYAAQLDSTEMALQVLRQRRRRYAGLDEAVARRRLLALLARRGYQSDTASVAVDQAWKEWQHDEGI